MRTIYFLLPFLLLAGYVQAQGTRPVTTSKNQPLPIPVIPDSVTESTTQLSNYIRYGMMNSGTITGWMLVKGRLFPGGVSGGI